METKNLRKLEKRVSETSHLEVVLREEKEKSRRARKQSEIVHGDLQSRKREIQNLERKLLDRENNIREISQKTKELELKMQFQKGERESEKQEFLREKKGWEQDKKTLSQQTRQIQSDYEKLTEKVSEKNREVESLKLERETSQRLIQKFQIEKQGYLGKFKKKNSSFQVNRKKIFASKIRIFPEKWSP